MDHHQAIQLQHDHESIFAGKEDVHIGDDLVVDDYQQPECEEGSILKEYVQEYSPGINAAAAVGGTVDRLYQRKFLDSTFITTLP